MKERFLLNCENMQCAEELVNALRKSGIQSRQRNNLLESSEGEYNENEGVALFVSEQDFDKATSIADSVLKARGQANPVCPNCGSAEVEFIDRKHNYASAVLLLCVGMIVLPGIYIALPKEFILRSDLMDTIAMLMAGAGFAILLMARHISDNYRCRHCGKTFQSLK